MEIPTLVVETRKSAGSRACARLRKAGKLPAIVYGHGQEPTPIALVTHDVTQHLKHGLHIVNLKVGSEMQPCQFKDAQYDYLGLDLVHVDLMRVDLNERIRVVVPIEFRGTAKGQAEGGICRHEIAELEVECVVTEIPDSIRVDVSHLALNQALHVKEIKLPGTVTHLLDPDAIVAVVKLPLQVADTVAAVPGAEGPAEPEVIAKGKVEVPGEEEEK